MLNSFLDFLDFYNSVKWWTESFVVERVLFCFMFLWDFNIYWCEVRNLPKSHNVKCIMSKGQHTKWIQPSESNQFRINRLGLFHNSDVHAAVQNQKVYCLLVLLGTMVVTVYMYTKLTILSQCLAGLWHAFYFASGYNIMLGFARLRA